VPERIAKNHDLSKRFTLFEVENWNVYARSADPYLLEHIEGSLFAIVAEWDVTPLEKAVLTDVLK
jgi:hypothetical protein